MSLEDRELPFKALKYNKTDLTSFNSQYDKIKSRSALSDVTSFDSQHDDIVPRVSPNINSLKFMDSQYDDILKGYQSIDITGINSLKDELSSNPFSPEQDYPYNFMSENSPLGNIDTFQSFFQQQENYGVSQTGYGQTYEYNTPDWSKNDFDELIDYYNASSPVLFGGGGGDSIRFSASNILIKDFSLTKGLGFVSQWVMKASMEGANASVTYIDSGPGGKALHFMADMNLFSAIEKITGNDIPQSTKNSIKIGSSVGKFLGLDVPDITQRFQASIPIPFTGVRTYSHQVAENIEGEGKIPNTGFLGALGEITGITTAGVDQVFSTISTDKGYADNIDKWEHQIRGVIFQVYGSQNRAGIIPDHRLQDSVHGNGLIIDWDLRNPIKSWTGGEFKLKVPDYVRAAGDWTQKAMNNTADFLLNSASGFAEWASPGLAAAGQWMGGGVSMLGQGLGSAGSFVGDAMGDLFSAAAKGSGYVLGGINDLYQDSVIDKLLTDLWGDSFGQIKGKLSFKANQGPSSALGFDFSQGGPLSLLVGVPAVLIQTGIDIGSELGGYALGVGKTAWDFGKKIADNINIPLPAGVPKINLSGLNPIEAFELPLIELQSPLTFEVFNFGGNIKLKLITPRQLIEARGRNILQPTSVAASDSVVMPKGKGITTPYSSFKELASDKTKWYGAHAGSYYPHKMGEKSGGDQITNAQLKKSKQSYDVGSGNLVEGLDQGMPFYFRDMRDGTYVILRGYISGLTEDVSPDWTETRYIGRSESVYTYNKAKRGINFTLRLYANTAIELEHIYTKLRRLTSMCYPMYLADVNMFGDLRMRPPYLKFRLGELYGNSTLEMLGFMNGINYTIPDQATWEWRQGKRVPKLIDAAIQFTVIHRKAPRASTPFYGYVPGKVAETNPVGEFGPNPPGVGEEIPATHAIGDIQSLKGT